MTTGKRVRWECPHGLHAGVLGSSRPRAEATIRFCLECSAEHAVLVRRVAPVLERKRAAKRQQRATAPARAQESVVARARVECPDATGRVVVVDLLTEVAECCAMLGHRPIQVTVKRMTSPIYSASGRGYPESNRVHFSVGPKATAERVRELALHEVLHVVAGDGRARAGSRANWHGPRFKRALYDAARERWPRIRGLVADESLIRSGKAYDLDDLIVAALQATAAEAI